MSALTFLSLRRSPRQEQLRPASNDDRLRAYRAYAPASIGNAYPWPHRQSEQYAAGERDLSADDIQLGFDFKYGSG